MEDESAFDVDRFIFFLVGSSGTVNFVVIGIGFVGSLIGTIGGGGGGRGGLSPKLESAILLLSDSSTSLSSSRSSIVPSSLIVMEWLRE